MSLSRQEVEAIVSKQVNDLREEIKEELAKIRKELLSEITYTNRNLEKKIEGMGSNEKSSQSPKSESKKADGYDLNSSASFKWVKEHLTDFTFQQTVDFFKKVIQSTNVQCDSVNSPNFSRNQNSFYKILDSVWDQLSGALNDNTEDLVKSCIQGAASLLSSFVSK